MKIMDLMKYIAIGFIFFLALSVIFEEKEQVAPVAPDAPSVYQLESGDLSSLSCSFFVAFTITDPFVVSGEHELNNVVDYWNSLTSAEKALIIEQCDERYSSSRVLSDDIVEYYRSK